MKTPYEILGVKAEATQDEVKNAYRKLAKLHHPDLNPGNKQAEQLFKEINQAYESVGTAESRAKHDRGEVDAAQAQASQQERARQYYSQTQGQGRQSRYSSAFNGMDEDLFGSIFGQERPSPPDLFSLEIDFTDAIRGAEREITLPNQKKLRITIPPGIESGKKLKFAGQGTRGGDLLIEIKVRPSTVFVRHGNHLEVEVTIPLSLALLGGEIKVPTLNGSILMNVPPGVSSGQKLRAAGLGVPAHGNRAAGDQRVNLKVQNPVKIDEEFKLAVEAWAKRQEAV